MWNSTARALRFRERDCRHQRKSGTRTTDSETNRASHRSLSYNSSNRKLGVGPISWNQDAPDSCTNAKRFEEGALTKATRSCEGVAASAFTTQLTSSWHTFTICRKMYASLKRTELDRKRDNALVCKALIRIRGTRAVQIEREVI
jgi:hypothetical protein